MDITLHNLFEFIKGYGSLGGLISLFMYMYFTRNRRFAETKKIEAETEIKLSKQTISVIEALQKEIERQHDEINSLRTRTDTLETQLLAKDERINLLQSQINAIALQCPTCPLKPKFNKS